MLARRRRASSRSPESETSTILRGVSQPGPGARAQRHGRTHAGSLRRLLELRPIKIVCVAGRRTRLVWMAQSPWSPLGLEQDLAAMREGEPFADHSVPGAYCCAGCGAQLYDSVTKIASTAFPSFKRANLGAVDLVDDFSFGMRRTAVLCAKCKAPLGHVYKEGKAKQRHVLLSRALKFREDEEQVEEIAARNAGVIRQPSAMRRLEPIIAATVPVLVVAALIWLRRRSERGSSE